MLVNQKHEIAVTDMRATGLTKVTSAAVTVEATHGSILCTRITLIFTFRYPTSMYTLILGVVVP